MIILIGIQSENLEKFPTVWQVLYSQNSDWNPTGSTQYCSVSVGHRQDLRWTEQNYSPLESARVQPDYMGER